MLELDMQAIIEEYHLYIEEKTFPCIAAKAASAKRQIKCFVADHIACPKDDKAILNFLYDFADIYRSSKEFYHSAAIIFKDYSPSTEEVFDKYFWQRLQSLSDLDAVNYGYDKRVNSDPSSPNFSFSLKEEAFYIIGLHPGSSRTSRQFKYPAMVFNPHKQFDILKETVKYDMMKRTVRKRDIEYSGSVNPMLHDFGEFSETFQYSGRQYNNTWQCPLMINHESIEHNPST